MGKSLDGTVKRRDGRIDLHFERHFDARVERLWAAVSEPKLMEGWLYGPVHELEPVEGGKVEILIYPKGKATVYGKVLRYEPPRLIELTWDVPAWTNLAGERIPDFFGTLMRWEVQPDGDGSKLLLTHSLLAEHDWHVHSIIGAWHLHLDGLSALLAGEPIPAFEEPDFFAMRERYAEFIGTIESIE